MCFSTHFRTVHGPGRIVCAAAAMDTATPGNRFPRQHTQGTDMTNNKETRDMNRDPISGAPGSHPIGTGVGATGGAMAGAAVGAVGGPVGMAVGGAIGAI